MIDKEFCDKASSASLGGYEVKYNTWDLCEKAIDEEIPGDFAEAGVYKGTHPMIMAKVASLKDPSRRIHLYDSFDGVPKVREERDDVEISAYGKSEDGDLISSGVAYASVEHTIQAFNANNAPLDMCVFHKGWFQDVLPNEQIPILSVLRLDTDLLESNEICMKYLYPRLSHGGYFITDDFSNETWENEYYRIIKELGFKKPEVFKVKGQETTAWWRKL